MFTGYILIGSRGQGAPHLHITPLVVPEYAAPQALMRMTVAIAVLQNAFKLFRVETFSYQDFWCC
jgi:hypothetical protein